MKNKKHKYIKVLVPFSRDIDLFLFIFSGYFLVKSQNNRNAPGPFLSWFLLTLKTEIAIATDETEVTN